MEHHHIFQRISDLFAIMAMVDGVTFSADPSTGILQNVSKA